MIPVGVTEQQVNLLYPSFYQGLTCTSYAHAGVDEYAGAGIHFEARGVAAVAGTLRRYHRKGAAHTPKTHLHEGSFYQQKPYKK